jgi:hypothetical protein
MTVRLSFVHFFSLTQIWLTCISPSHSVPLERVNVYINFTAPLQLQKIEISLVCIAEGFISFPLYDHSVPPAAVRFRPPVVPASKDRQ